jgi:hypothetical protein
MLRSQTLAGCGQSPSMAFGRSKSCAFHGSCTPGTSSLRCGRLFVHSLLSDAQCGACAGGGQGKTPVPAGGAPPGEIDAIVALTGQTVLG